MIEAGLVQIAEDFWAAAGCAPSLPRDLAPLISRQLPVSMVPLSDLSITRIERWLADRHVPYRFLCHNRALCGCLVAMRGYGILFIDSQDTPADRRFTVAHEIAHFLLDYDAPRRRALSLFGDRIRPVLDGERVPTPQERIDGLLSSTPLGMFFDLMPRDAQGGIDQGSVLRTENRADRLALELLAPAEEVLAHVGPTGMNTVAQAQALNDLLVGTYGLPRSTAHMYTSMLLRDRVPSTAQWLGL